MNVLTNLEGVVVFGTTREMTQVDGKTYIDGALYSVAPLTMFLNVAGPETPFIEYGYTYINGEWSVHDAALVDSVSPKNPWAAARKAEYLSAEQQLEMIFDHGIDAWKAHVQSIKNKYPKPE